MKKIVIVLMIFAGVTAIAQKGERGNRERMKSFTPEQTASLQTKKATLALDLSDSQQVQMKALLLDNAKMRQSKMEDRKAKKESDDSKKPSSEERYAVANERLDHQIAQKAKLKNILSDEQFAKWEKMQHRSGKHRKSRGDRNRKASNKKSKK